MKKLLVVMAAVGLIAVPAMAGTVHDPWSTSSSGDELNLFEVVNALYGTGFGASSEMEFAMLDPDEVFTGTQGILAEARYAEYAEEFGWYQFTGSGDPTDLTSLFTVTAAGIGNLGSGLISPSGNYGFFDTAGPSSDPDRYTWFSESDENADNEDHMIAYDLALLTGDSAYDGIMLAAWEDLPFSLGDEDYQDLVLQLRPVPEPTTLVLLGLGCLGAIMRKRFIA